MNEFVDHTTSRPPVKTQRGRDFLRSDGKPMGRELAWKVLVRHFEQVFVVREKDDLPLIGKYGKNLKRCRGAFVVELDQDVVNNEWQAAAGCSLQLQAGQA